MHCLPDFSHHLQRDEGGQDGHDGVEGDCRRGGEGPPRVQGAEADAEREVDDERGGGRGWEEGRDPADVQGVRDVQEEGQDGEKSGQNGQQVKNYFTPVTPTTTKPFDVGV